MTRKPLVLVSGQIQTLQAADTLDIPSVTAGDVVQLTNSEASPIVIGTPVYMFAADAVKKAKADAAGTKDVMGLVRDASITNATSGSIQLNGVLAMSTAQADAAFGTTGGFTFGTRYYLSAGTAGLGTATAPSTVGQYVQEIGIGVSTTEINIDVKSPILL